MSGSTTHTIVALALATTFAALHLNARLDLSHSELEFRNRVWSSAPLPAAPFFAATTLNHTTLAADIAWSWTVIENTEARREGRTSDAMPWNAAQVAALDPKFYPVYTWFSAAYLMYRWPVTHDDLERVNRFLDGGIAAYPSDPDLPVSAALNYMGYSARHAREDRLKQTERALTYLRSAAAQSNARDDVPALLFYFEKRKARLEGRTTSSASDADTYIQLLQQTTAPDVREALIEALRRLGVSDEEVFAKLDSSEAVLRRRYLRESPYTPQNLWLSSSMDGTP